MNARELVHNCIMHSPLPRIPLASTFLWSQGKQCVVRCCSNFRGSPLIFPVSLPPCLGVICVSIASRVLLHCLAAPASLLVRNLSSGVGSHGVSRPLVLYMRTCISYHRLLYSAIWSLLHSFMWLIDPNANSSKTNLWFLTNEIMRKQFYYREKYSLAFFERNSNRTSFKLIEVEYSFSWQLIYVFTIS